MTDNAERPEIVEDAPLDQIITEDFIARFEKQAELYQNRYLPICFRLTNEADWISHARDRYYLQASGAEKICNPLGIVWERPVVTKHEREDESGHFYEYEVEGIMQSRVLARYGWFSGNCSSRDQFFVARGRFDEGDIRKSALSNWITNGVTRLAGIRNPSTELLRKAGLDPSKIQTIDYSGRRTPEQDSQIISEAQRKRLWAISKASGTSDEQMRVWLFDTYEIKSSGDIPRGKYDEIVAKIQAGEAKKQPDPAKV
mgnify:FL=1